MTNEQAPMPIDLMALVIGAWYFQVISISSGKELLAALEGGYETWRAYRDQVRQTSQGD